MKIEFGNILTVILRENPRNYFLFEPSVTFDFITKGKVKSALFSVLITIVALYSFEDNSSQSIHALMINRSKVHGSVNNKLHY